eukprot:CAMPEP_0170169230 /NCGR_PEP_ID=MMETSP0040_2-20121228/2158_1 /TAXON_ID=641309 /ORGANISM="Lotharella oceanica, Strain CCMP622" /LENGTH=66 /DNA_ID=CAMNT_0010407859 /DNA_START=533 /DNA_END=733 /DNA_ORIENTATION=+
MRRNIIISRIANTAPKAMLLDSEFAAVESPWDTDDGGSGTFSLFIALASRMKGALASAARHMEAEP